MPTQFMDGPYIPMPSCFKICNHQFSDKKKSEFPGSLEQSYLMSHIHYEKYYTGSPKIGKDYRLFVEILTF